MGIIYNENVKEKELYSAYGLTVYGKENRYESVWSPDVEFAYITLRISEAEHNPLPSTSAMSSSVYFFI